METMPHRGVGIWVLTGVGQGDGLVANEVVAWLPSSWHRIRVEQWCGSWYDV